MPVFGIAAHNVVGSIESKDKKSIRVGRLVSKAINFQSFWSFGLLAGTVEDLTGVVGPVSKFFCYGVQVCLGHADVPEPVR